MIFHTDPKYTLSLNGTMYINEQTKNAVNIPDLA